MKVKNVNRVENNPDSFNQTVLSEENRREQASQKNIASMNNVQDVVDINITDTELGEAPNEGEEVQGKENTAKSETVFYNNKNSAGKNRANSDSEKVSPKNLINRNSENSQSAENGSQGETAVKEKMILGKNEYDKTLPDLVNSKGGATRREYGNASKLNSFVNPNSSTVKNPFYSKQAAEGSIVKGFGTTVNEDFPQNTALNTRNYAVVNDGGDESKATPIFNKAADTGGSDIPSLKTTRVLLNTENYGNSENSENIKNNIADLKAFHNKVPVNETSDAKNINISSNESSNMYSLKSLEGKEPLNFTNRNADAATNANVNANVNADVHAIADADLNDDRVLKSYEDTSIKNDSHSLYKDVKTVSNLQGEKKHIDFEARNSDYKHSSIRNAQEASYRYGAENVSEKIDILGIKSRRNINNSENGDIQLERDNINFRDYMIAQAAYQGIVHRNINDVYKSTPELEKLIVLLFRLRKLTIKKIEKNLTGEYDSRKTDDEAELILTEAKNLIEHGGYKKNRIITVLNQFLDEQERIKSCVGLSPFPIEIKDFERFFNSIKSETEEIKDGVEKARREEIRNSIVKILGLSLLVIIFYIIFLR